MPKGEGRVEAGKRLRGVSLLKPALAEVLQGEIFEGSKFGGTAPGQRERPPVYGLGRRMIAAIAVRLREANQVRDFGAREPERPARATARVRCAIASAVRPTMRNALPR